MKDDDYRLASIEEAKSLSGDRLVGFVYEKNFPNHGIWEGIITEYIPLTGLYKGEYQFPQHH